MSEHFEKEVIGLLETIISVLRNRPGIAVAVKTQFEKGETKMSLTAPANTQNERFYAIGVDANGVAGASLGPGQTISIVSSDPATVDFGPADSPAGKDAEGVQSMLGCAVIFKNPPAQLGVPVNVTLSILNADGSAADGTPLVDTVTVTAPVAGVATSVGDLFEGGIAAKGLRAAKPSDGGSSGRVADIPSGLPTRK
jgi:hypothetical protein